MPLTADDQIASALAQLRSDFEHDLSMYDEIGAIIADLSRARAYARQRLEEVLARQSVGTAPTDRPPFDIDRLWAGTYQGTGRRQ
jgi:hypothetical protein